VHETEPPGVELVAEKEYALGAKAAVSVTTESTTAVAGFDAPV
jgi:hypothetical protein